MLKKLIIGAALIATSAASSAGVITQSFFFGNDTTDNFGVSTTSSLGLLETNWGGSFNFDLFDDMGGTLILNSVVLTLNATSNGFIDSTNNGTTPNDFTLELGAELTIDGFGLSNLITVLPLFSQTFNNVTPGDTVSTGTVTTPDSNAASYNSGSTGIDGIIFDSFIGPGTDSFDVAASSEFDGGGSGSGSIDFEVNALGSLVIEYNYSEAGVLSAPNHIALLGLTLIGIAGMRRIKK